jgi:hypothetical protein
LRADVTMHGKDGRYDSRLVRETLSFSKKLEHHIGAIWYFIHDYNSLRMAV